MRQEKASLFPLSIRITSASFSTFLYRKEVAGLHRVCSLHRLLIRDNLIYNILDDGHQFKAILLDLICHIIL